MPTIEKILFQYPTPLSLEDIPELPPRIVEDEPLGPIFHIGPASEADAALLADCDSFDGLIIGHLDDGTPAMWALGSDFNSFHSKTP